MDLWTCSNPFKSITPNIYFDFVLISWAQSEICPNVKHGSNGLRGWRYYEASLKLLDLKSLLCYITLGHFLLLSPSPAAEDSGICEYHLTSPVLPGSDGNCIFQVALYEAGGAAGNLTLLIKPALLDSVAHSVLLNHRSHDNHRLVSTLRTCSPCHCNAVCGEQLFILLVHFLCSTTDQLN